MDNMLDDTRYTFGEVYAFINDRFRAISKSLTVQHCRDTHFVECLVHAIRFRALSGFLLKGSTHDGQLFWPNYKHNNVAIGLYFKDLTQYDMDNPKIRRPSEKEIF